MSCGLGCPLHRKELNWAMTVEKNCSASPGRRVELDRPCRNGAFFPLGAGLESSLPLLADAAWLLCLGELPGGPFCGADALRKRLHILLLRKGVPRVQRKPRERTSLLDERFWKCHLDQTVGQQLV